MAEVFFDDQWVPICGHYFWNNNVGSNLFCQEKGFKSGKIVHRIPLKSDALRIGTCHDGDTFPNCSQAKSNAMSFGGDEWSCNSGNGLGNAGIVIDCEGKNYLFITTVGTLEVAT